MKKIIGNIAVKIVAVILSFVLFFTMLISLAGSAIMLYTDFYTRDFTTLESNIMQTLAASEMNNLIARFCEGEAYTKKYYEDKNVLYTVHNTVSDSTSSNYEGQDYICEYTVTEFITLYVDKTGVIYDSGEVCYDYENDYYYHYAENQQLYETNQKAVFTIYIPRNMQFTDRFFLVDKLINVGFNNRYTMIFTAITSLILCIVIYSFIFISLGHKNDYNNINVALINDIPADILTIGVFIVFLIGSVLFT